MGIDQNPELINFYEVVKNKPEELYKCLQEKFYPHHSEEFYYRVRGHAGGHSHMVHGIIARGEAKCFKFGTCRLILKQDIKEMIGYSDALDRK